MSGNTKKETPKDPPKKKTQNTASKSKKIVSFQAPPPPPDNHPTKVHVGKANVWRELGIPALFLGVAIMFCRGISDIGTKTNKKPNPIELMQTLISQTAEHAYNKRGGPMAPSPCQLFLAHSSIPGAGDALFAGKDYQEGDTIVLPTITEFVPSLEIPQSAFLLKPHHRLANVEGGMVRDGSSSVPIELKATRSIRAGEELILPYHSHPMSRASQDLFRGIPGQEEFETAEAIVRDIVDRFGRKKGRGKKETQIVPTLNLIYKTTRRLNRMVSNFLPTTKAELDRWIKQWQDDTPFEALALKQKSVQGLEMNAKCLSYVMQHPQSPKSILTTQEISQGTIVLPVPFLILPEEQTCAAEECSQQTHSSPCRQFTNLPFRLCALTLPVWLDAPDEGQDANVEYQWGRENRFNEKSHLLSAEQLVEQYTTQLSLDLVALRDIEPGETLRVKSGLEELIPEQWKMA